MPSAVPRLLESLVPVLIFVFLLPLLAAGVSLFLLVFSVPPPVLHAPFGVADFFADGISSSSRESFRLNRA